MKSILPQLKSYILFLFIAVISSYAYGQEVPFNCDYNAYLFQYNDAYAIDLASGNSYLVAQDITPGSINAAAYNPVDGYIWGSLSSPQKSIVKIGRDFETTTYYVDELPTSNRYVGAISAEGVYFLKGGGTTYYKINLDPVSETYTQHIATESLTLNINIHDWAFNALDGMLYSVEKNTNILYRIDPSNGNVQNLGEVPILSGLNYTYGAVYFDASGRFYVSANQTGTIYVIQNVQDIEASNNIDSNLFAFGPSSSQNDGARCPTAPVAQEDCSNGIDDDGDGLIDCEDPSCSGYGTCDVITPPSSGNDGGLESNSRLSEAISKRNFNRAKRNFKFNQLAAKRVVKTAKYAQRNENNNFQLQDFIPIGAINEDYAIDSSPSDLLDITNAIEVFSVDYMQNDTSIASILALKTENGVYEHTKYICDRLLGAELISVSTIDIDERSFIKSIIKNVDGSYEYVLSLSAKIVNNDTNFSIESHWNLDRYESDVTFYNFQIWSNSVDDLYLLGEEVLNLLNIGKPISEYNNSTPPTVFVRKGKYVNGVLDLQIINTNATENVTLDAGYRATETSEFNNTSSTISLNEEGLITNTEVATGNLFDIGFRIGDGIATPDDLFMSDGPWGVDDSHESTTVITYTVTPNTNSFSANDFPIERNVSLFSTTKDYIALYRALTPRFKAVDLTAYNSINLKANGTGIMQITLVKESISNWEEQYKTSITLTSDYQDFSIAFADFIAPSGQELILDDVTTIVFTMVSDDGTLMAKAMNLENVRFSQNGTLSIINQEQESNNISAIPNPMLTSAKVHFKSDQNETVNFIVYDQVGKVVKSFNFKAAAGNNQIVIKKDNLSSGLYFCKILSDYKNFETLKLLVK